MDPKDRAELDRLLDIAEREEIMRRAPTLEQVRELETRRLVAEREVDVAELERASEAVKARREGLAPDAEWIEED